MARLKVNPTAKIVEQSGLLTREGFNLLAQIADKPGKYAIDVPAADGTGATVAHGLGSPDVTVQVRVKATGAHEAVTVTVLDADRISLTWGASVTAGSRRVVVTG
mgnify:FL=1|jgi:hypothetical protein